MLGTKEEMSLVLKNVIRRHQAQLYANKLDPLDEMEKNPSKTQAIKVLSR